jgi:nucleoside-diphosphate-sugar epimerase
VATGTPSVVFDGKDIEGADESLPYAKRFLADYPRTKAEAERLLLASRDVPVVSLRPHLIWGPGDRHLLPRLLSRAGKLKRVGRGDPLIDTTYIDNCVHAHLLAADRLLEAPAQVGGKAYFIGDAQPIGMWTMANHLLAAAGAPPIEGRIPYPLAYGAAAILELAHELLGKEGEPLLTRFAVQQFARAQWYDLGAARQDLGYAPVVTIDEGLVRLHASLEKSSVIQ